nr:hypothetical protein Iba_chr01aCG2270 [Ipomoea batatas]
MVARLTPDQKVACSIHVGEEVGWATTVRARREDRQLARWELGVVIDGGARHDDCDDLAEFGVRRLLVARATTAGSKVVALGVATATT